MSSRHPRSAPARDSAPVDNPWNLLHDIGRHQAAAMMEGASAAFRGAEAMRKIQMQAAHEACARHEAAGQKLELSAGPGDLLAVGAELFRFDLQAASQYWQQLAAAGLKTQLDMMACASHLATPVPADMGNPALDAWQAAVAGALNGSATAYANA